MRGFQFSSNFTKLYVKIPKYAQLMSFESTEKRDYYFPSPDSVNAEIVDEYNEVFEKTDANAYLEETPSYTDYFRVN